MGDRVDFERGDRPSTAQPPPLVDVPGAIAVHPAAADMLDSIGLDPLASLVMERGDFGARKYGTPLRTNNGRDAVADALEEALDVLAYLTQKMLESDGIESRRWSAIFYSQAGIAEALRRELSGS